MDGAKSREKRTGENRLSLHISYLLRVAENFGFQFVQRIEFPFRTQKIDQFNLDRVAVQITVKVQYPWLYRHRFPVHGRPRTDIHNSAETPVIKNRFGSIHAEFRN